MLTLYSYPGTRGLRVTWAAEELGVDYEFKLINLYKGEHRGAEFLALNPAGKVPAISIDDIVMCESGAILTFLGDKLGKLIPATGTANRARYEQLMSFVLTELEQPLWTIAKHQFALPEEKRIKEIQPIGAWEFERALDAFSSMLGDSEYILSDGFSLVDIMAGQTLAWAKSAKQPIEQENVKAYMQRVLSRDGLRRAKDKEKQMATLAGID